jgi:hypothetical protein
MTITASPMKRGPTFSVPCPYVSSILQKPPRLIQITTKARIMEGYAFTFVVKPIFIAPLSFINRVDRSMLSEQFR